MIIWISLLKLKIKTFMKEKNEFLIKKNFIWNLKIYAPTFDKLIYRKTIEFIEE